MSSFNRDGVKRRLVEILAAALGSEWDVSYEWPGDDVGDRWLYLDAAVDGSTDNPTTKGAPGSKRLTIDTFAFDALLCVQGCENAQVAEKLAADGVRLVDDTLRRLTHLKDPTEVIGDGTAADYEGVQSARLTRVQGPAASAPQPGDDLLSGMCLLTITCTSHFTS